MKFIAILFAGLMTAQVAAAQKMTYQQAQLMRQAIYQEQQRVNAQQAFVSQLQAELSKKQQTHAVKSGAVKAAQWTTLPIAAFEMGRLVYALGHETHRIAQFVLYGAKVPGTKINVRKQVIIVSTAMAAYYGSDAYNNTYLVVENKNIDLLQSQLSKALEVLLARQAALDSMQSSLDGEFVIEQ